MTPQAPVKSAQNPQPQDRKYLKLELGTELIVLRYLQIQLLFIHTSYYIF